MTSKATALALALLLGSASSDATDGEHFEARALTERLLSITGLLPSHAVVLELRRLADDPSRDIEVREQALAEYALGLRDYAPDPASWAGLEFLAAYRERAFQPHPEISTYQVPRFNVAATARGTLNVWLRVSARRQTAADLAAGRYDFLDLPGRRAHRQQLEGIVEALNEAEAAPLRAVREALRSRYPADASLTPIALAVAARLDDEALLGQIISHDSALKFRTTYELDRYLDARRAERRWRRLAGDDDPEVAAAAIAALADKAMPSAALFDLLAARLDDPDVGVAAAGALARLRLPGGIPRLASLLNSTDAVIAARAALALKLNGSPAALTALRASPLNEVRQWLR